MWYNAPYNVEIIKFLQHLFNPSGSENAIASSIFQYITMFGEEYFFIVVIGLVYWCINKKLGYRIGFAFLSTNVINSGIKGVLSVPRPFNDIEKDQIFSLRIETAGGYSFPSGHTQGATSFWVAMMTNIRKRWVYIIGAVIILGVGTSRLYLGVHRPIDVFAGLLIGIVWVFIANWMFDYADKKGNKAVFLIFVLPMIIGMFFLKYSDYYKAAGTVLGFFLGYIIEPKYIDFEVKVEYWKQALKLLIGLGTVLAIKTFVKILLPETMLSDFFRYLLMGLWVTVGAPYIFKYLFKSKASVLKNRLTSNPDK